MSEPPLISIIIAVYNGERFLAATLDSIRAQTLRGWECLIVDDGSVDGTRAVAERYAEMDDRFRVTTQENGGPAKARNLGFTKIRAGSRYVSFMDSDDIWSPDALGTLVDELERFPEAVGAHGLADYIDENGKPAKEAFAEIGRNRVGYDGGRQSKADLSEPTTFGLLAWTNRVFPPGVLLARRAAYERAGLFDSAFRQIDDWDMIVRLSRYGDLRFINRVIISYRRHDANISGAKAGEMARALRLMQHKIFFSPENTEEHKRILIKGWRTLQVLHAGRKWQSAKEKLAEGKIMEGGKLLAGLGVQLLRYLRGYPTRHGI